jgi:type IX secretion system PorP/SprF family membrane protein
MKFRLYIFFVLLVFQGMTQDFHFSQTSQSPLLINPGCAGAFDGWERISLNQRNQWMGSNSKFTTTNFSFDGNLYKNLRKPASHIGFGIQFYNDMGGDSKFGTRNGSLTLSGILPMAPGHQISIGIQGGFGSKRGDISKLTFENQWNGTDFDPSLASGEVNSLNSFAYAEVASGIYYIYDAGKSSFSRNNESKIQLGLSGYHLNQPKLRYIQGTTDRLKRKYVFHGSIIKDILDSKWSIDAGVFQFIQGSHKETMVSTMFRYRLQEGTKQTGFYGEAHVGFGLNYRYKDAIIPAFMLDMQSLKFMLSFDFTTSQLRRANGSNSLELSLVYTNLHNAIFKSRNHNKKSIKVKH